MATGAAQAWRISENGAIRASPAAVAVRNVTKSFPVTLSIAAWVRYRGAVPRRTVLHDVSFEVKHGELFGLLGPNGAGKTTLLKTLATLCIPETGQVVISGIDAAKQPMAVKEKIALCSSEERSFYFRLTARENLRFFGSLAGLFGGALEARISDVASLVDLSSALDRRYDTFSSGMRQRLAFARALLGDPDIIFFDEPTRAVDPLHARTLRTFIREELTSRRHKTVILATNSLEEAWGICDTVAIVHNGRIVAKGAPHVLDMEFTRCLRYRITLESAPPSLIETLERVSGVRRITLQEALNGVDLSVELEPDGHAVNSLLAALTASGVMVLGLRSENPQPLDVFAGLTHDGTN